MAGDPRIRGEHESSTSRSRPSPGSSPHTRGARPDGRRRAGALGIIPAYAGSTSPDEAIPMKRGDHPRIRGEHVAGRSDPHEERGSSPHTWGAPCHRCSRRARSGIIPAYAGSTSNALRICSLASDHPRIRGEHGDMNPPPGVPVGSSPHTRGAHRVLGRPAERQRNHPRIRGEHTHRPDGGRRDRGIIPAYAGSTLIPCSRATSSSDHPRIRGEHAVGEWRWVCT